MLHDFILKDYLNIGCVLTDYLNNKLFSQRLSQNKHLISHSSAGPVLDSGPSLPLVSSGRIIILLLRVAIAKVTYCHHMALPYLLGLKSSSIIWILGCHFRREDGQTFQRNFSWFILNLFDWDSTEDRTNLKNAVQ